MPFGVPVPPSPETSAALRRSSPSATSRSSRAPDRLDRPRRAASPCSTTATELPFDLFLGVPKHRAPDVVIDSGMTEDGYVPVDSATLETRSRASTPSATWPRPACRRRACSPRARRESWPQNLIAELAGGEQPAPYDGRGSCYIEFGQGPRRRGRHRLPLGTDDDRSLQPAFGGARRREGGVRLQPGRALVRRLSAAKRPPRRTCRGCRERCPTRRCDRAPFPRSHRPLWVKRHRVAPSASSKSTSISVAARVVVPDPGEGQPGGAVDLGVDAAAAVVVALVGSRMTTRIVAADAQVDHGLGRRPAAARRATSGA